jgi:hypothetical protein
MLILRPTARATFQPGPDARIDRSHALARGLVGLLVPNRAGSLVNLVTSQPIGGSPTFGRHARGVTAENYTGNTAATTEWNFSSGPWSVAAYGHVTDVTGSEQPTLIGRNAYVSESDNQGWELGGVSTGAYRFLVFNNNGFANYNLNGSSSRVNGPVALAGTTDGTTRRLWVNGAEEANTALNANAASATAGLSNASAATEHQHCYIAYAWNRELSARDVAELARDPFALLTTRSAMVVVPAAAASMGRVFSSPMFGSRVIRSAA